jgi:hypothetical protein
MKKFGHPIFIAAKLQSFGIETHRGMGKNWRCWGFARHWQWHVGNRIAG